MAISAITFLCFPCERVYESRIRYFLLALSVCLLIGSQSKGSYAVMPVLILLIFVYRLLHLDWRRLIPAATAALAIVTLGAVYVGSNTDEILQGLGKNATLTGRIPLWTLLLTLSSNKAWLGYGFAGFWSTNLLKVRSIVGWAPGKAHNGFIDILLEVGLLGLGIFVLNSVIASWGSMKLIARERTLHSQWPLLMLSLIFLYNIFESDLMVPNGFLWVVYVAITASRQRAWNVSRATTRITSPAATQFSAPAY